MSEGDIERWTREVAENPGAPSFVRLARAYRAQGRRDAARDVVLQGLEHNPEHIGAHGLLALMHVEDGERAKAADEWQTVLALEPGNFGASRGLGFLALERGDLAAARRHLEAAAEARPEEPAVTRALEVLERRESGSSHGGSDHSDGGSRSSSRGAGKGTRGKGGGPSGAGASAGSGHGSGPGQGSATGPGWAAETSDPARLFDALADEAPFLGAVVLDEQGLVLAGRIDVDGAGEELLGALINTAVDEARRTTELLGLGEWDGMLLDGDQATLHVAELADGAVVLMAVRSDAPSGWAVRTAERAQALARDFLEERG